MTPEELTVFVKTECSNVAKMLKPLTVEQAKALLRQYPADDLIAQLQKMDNYAMLRKKYVSAYLTCLKWFEMDIAKGYYKRQARVDALKSFEQRERAFFERYPVGSEFTSKTGRRWLVESLQFLRCLDDNSLLPVAAMLKYNDSS